jgi:nucleoside-diphosphate-sugar epimerase
MTRAVHRTAEPFQNALARDLDHVLAHTASIWEALRGKRIFISGGTGFFGTWLLESFVWAQDRLGLDAQVVVLTRNKETFAHKAPHLSSHRAIRFVTGDIRNFKAPGGEFDYIIHGAASTGQESLRSDALLAFDTTVTGTRNMLRFAVEKHAKRFLFISSGAVYGRQPPGMSHISESYTGAPWLQDVVYTYTASGEAKRVGELLCFMYHNQFGLGATIARCFTFVGPYLPMDVSYAAANFIRDALDGGPIVITGDGTPYRSYLYAADLAIWLWTLLIKAPAGEAYNVGSDKALTIAQLAASVATCFKPAIKVITKETPRPSEPAQRYVPSTTKAERELGLRPFIDFEESVRRTIEWYRGNPQAK